MLLHFLLLLSSESPSDVSSSADEPFSPPPLPPLEPGEYIEVILCSDDGTLCDYNADGTCDDGGASASYSDCKSCLLSNPGPL